MIRESKQEDLELLADYCVKFWLTTDYDDEPDREHMLGMLKLCHDHGTLMVSVANKKPVGFLATIVGPLLGNSKVKVGVELAWWMEPEYRGKGEAIKLIQDMEFRLKQKGVKYNSMLSMQSSMPDQVNKLYEKLGYKHSETSYTRVL